MKKQVIFTAVLSFIMALGLCACGSEEDVGIATEYTTEQSATYTDDAEDDTEEKEYTTIDDDEEDTDGNERVQNTEAKEKVTTVTNSMGVSFVLATDAGGAVKTDTAGAQVTELYTTAIHTTTTKATKENQTTNTTVKTEASGGQSATESTQATDNNGETVSVAYIHLSSKGITTEGDHMVVSADGKQVVISASGDYYIDGSMTGQIFVNIPDLVSDCETVKLHLNGVDLTGATDAAIYVENAEKTSIILEEGTENFITDAEGFLNSNAAIYAKDDLSIKGSGTLNITALYQRGIQCNNDLKISNGNIKIETAIADAIRGKDSIVIKGGNLSVRSEEADGLKSSNGNIEIQDGVLNVKAAKDAFQAKTDIVIQGGTVNANGDRGLTAEEGGVWIDGGIVCASATDYQPAVVGGAQSSMLLNYQGLEFIKDTEIKLVSANTSVFAPHKKFSYVLISMPELNGTYTVYTNGSEMVHNGGESFTVSGVSIFEQVRGK